VPGPPRSLTADLQAALDHTNGQPISVGELLGVLHERGHALVLLVLCLPFLVPIPTMGLSAPIGFAVAVYGLCVIIGVNPWIPKFVARYQISHGALERIVNTACRTGARVEKMLKPRLTFMLWPGVNRLIGICLIFLGLFISLPLPIPFTNSVPTVGVILLLLGIIERDGVFVILGQIMCVVIAVVLYFAWNIVVEVLIRIAAKVGLAVAEFDASYFYAVL